MMGKCLSVISEINENSWTQIPQFGQNYFIVNKTVQL